MYEGRKGVVSTCISIGGYVVCVLGSLSVLTSCDDCKDMLLLLFVVKTSCRGDDPCDLINGEEVGGSGEQNNTIIAFITVSGRNLGGRGERIDTQSIIKPSICPFNTHRFSPSLYTSILHPHTRSPTYIP